MVFQTTKHLSLVLILLIPILGYSQENKVYETFKGTRIVNGHSIETNREGDLTFIISHRFGQIDGGLQELFGLDGATIRLGLDYGLTNNIMIGIGRSSFEKTVDGYFKFRFLDQQSGSGSPIGVAFIQGMAINTADFTDPSRENLFSSRLFYHSQLLISRKFNDRFSLQLMPTYVHRNLVPNSIVNNDIWAIGAAGRAQITKGFAILVEYYQNIEGEVAEGFQDYSLSLGFEFETKGHIFQFSVSSARGMTEKFFIGESRGDFFNGDLHLGFNITRDFRIRGRKY